MNLKLVIVVCLLMLTTTRRHLKRFEQPQETKQVVQSNRFYSQTQRKFTSHISNLKKNQALVFVLKNKNSNDNEKLASNPITIELISKQEKSKCTFSNYHNMCSLKNIQDDNIEVNIECKSTPCQVSWRVQQPTTVQKDGIHKIDELVEVNKDFNHAFITVSCDDPNVQNFQQNLQLFTNSIYTSVVNQAKVYYLFDNEEKGYYFLTSEDPATKACAQISIVHNMDQIYFNRADKIIMDYILPSKTNTYQIQEIPSTDFTMDAYFHSALLKQLSNKQSITVDLMGEKGKQRIKLQSLKVIGQEYFSVDFDVVFKKTASQYQKLAIDITNTGESILILDMTFKSGSRTEVNLGQTSYFSIKKGQKIDYKLVPQTVESTSTDQPKTHIFSSDTNKFSLSIEQCQTKIGCQFSLEAKQDGDGNLYFGQSPEKKVGEHVVTEFKDSVTKIIREGEILLLKTPVKAKKSFQAVINCQNVLVYAASKEKCPEISSQCHEKLLNFHNPFIYESDSDHDLYFSVLGLNNGEFTLTLIHEGTEYIKLQDTKPFSYLFDDQQRSLKFQFTLDKKQDVNFNLIGPAKQLNLLVLNGDRWNEQNMGEGQLSTDGYISFKEDDIDSLKFVIQVEKRQQFIKKAVHFTLLASTKQGNIRLQSGTSHFENIKAEETRDYVFQFQPEKQILLNFYTHNVHTPLDIQVKVSNTDDYAKEKDVMTFDLEDQSEVLNLKPVSEELCKKQRAQNCELFVRLQNKMAIQLDITLTLMMRDSVIELQDGMWNSFRQNQISKTTHFYFLPKHPNKSISILYHADHVDLKVMYSIWKTDDKSIDPSEWPFPIQIVTQNDKVNSPELYYRPTKMIHLDAAALKQCWPSCVLLLTVFDDKSGPKSKYDFVQNTAFKIMASNNYIQIPEKHKVDIMLKKDQQKHLLVDLKYVMQKNALTFFTYFTIGSVTLSGNVYDEQNPRCPTGDSPGDFRFGNVETQISVNTIKKHLKENDMNEEKHPSICILVTALQDTKFSIQYDSNDEIMTHLMLDSSYVYKGIKDKVKIVQVDASVQYSLKITRSQGFPFIDKETCKNGEDFESCLNDFKQKSQKGDQFLDKIMEIKEQPCEKCILFIKITSPEPSVITLHLQSHYAQTELQQKRSTTDQVSKGEVNKYLITGIKNQQLIINIHIIHGNLKVTVNDLDQINITKTNEQNKDHIGITIPPKNETKNSPLWGSILYNMYSHSTFTSYHVSVESNQPNATAMYSITYSSGQPESYLQDGLITTFILMPKRTTKFLYKSPSLNKIYLHISSKTVEALNKFHIKILSMSDEHDQDTGVLITPEKANFSKATPNPTLILVLPANKFFQISVENTNINFEVITIGVNNQQIIYLPFNHEFPVQLNKNQSIWLVINSPFEIFMEIIIKKCGESAMKVGYTLNYEQFSKQQFQHEEEMPSEQLVNVIHLKSKTRGAVYLKLQSSPDQVSVVTVRANIVFYKSKLERPKAGGKGLIDYQLMDSRTARLQFDPVECPATNKNCYKDYTYSQISSDKLEGVYAQLVCPSIAFSLEDRQILSEGKSAPVHTSKFSNSRISFTENMKGDVDYVGVKAQNKKTGDVVYYKPIEIATFWGQVEKKGKGNNDVIGVVLMLCVICCIMLALRKRRLRLSEYAPLQSIQ